MGEGAKHLSPVQVMLLAIVGIVLLVGWLGVWLHWW